MKQHKINSQTLLSMLWIFILFNMIFRDLHQFLAEGFIEKMMAQKVSESSLLFFGFILEIPILMVLLSRVLNNKWNKWVNIVAAFIVGLGMLSQIPSGDLDDIFFAVMELAAIVVIVITAWKLHGNGHGT